MKKNTNNIEINSNNLSKIQMQIPLEIEVKSINISGLKNTSLFNSVTISYQGVSTTLMIGDKLTFTIPYVTKMISEHEHKLGEEFCPGCGERLYYD